MTRPHLRCRNPDCHRGTTINPTTGRHNLCPNCHGYGIQPPKGKITIPKEDQP